MKSRAFNKKIEVWQLDKVADGYGGYTTSESILLNSWCNLKTLNANSNLNNEFGVLDASNSIIVTLRKRNDLTYNLQTMFLKYRGQKYIIKSFPVNKNFEDSNITIVATKESNSLLNNTSDQTFTLNNDLNGDI